MKATDQRALVRRDSSGIERPTQLSKPQQSAEIVQLESPVDLRPAQYETLKRRGVPAQPLKLPPPPNILAVTLSAVIALSFLIAISMASIALTAYSKSNDRHDQRYRQEYREYMRLD